MSGRKISFIKNLATIFVGSIATKLVAFFLVPLYTSILSNDEYGSVDLTITTASLVLPLFTGVIFEALLRFSLDDKQNKKIVFSAAIYIDIIGIFVFLIFSPLALIYPPLGAYYLYFVLYFISIVINDTVLYFARGLNRIKEYTFASILQTTLLCVFNIIFLVVFKWGITGYFISYIMSSFFASVFLWFILRMYSYIISPKNISKQTAKEMLSYSLPMIPNTISWWVSNSSDRFFIIEMCSVAANGIYAVAYKIPTIISLGTSIFNTAWQITAVEDYNNNESKKNFSKMCFDYYSIVFISGSCVVFFTRILSKILFKHSFFDAWIYVPILVVAACFHSFSTFIGSVFTTIKKTKYMSYTTIVGAVTNIILNFVLIKFLGPIGAAIATLISYMVVYIFRFYFAQKIYYYKIDVINDVLCTLLILFQMIIVCLNLAYSYYFSAFIVFAIILFRRKSLKNLCSAFINKFKFSKKG